MRDKKHNIGTIRAASTTPSPPGLPASNTANASATGPIELPTNETTRPAAFRRTALMYLRTGSGLNYGRFRRVVAPRGGFGG
ncbi:hypothetical protein GCM10010522_19530 [Kribbella solani]